MIRDTRFARWQGTARYGFAVAIVVAAWFARESFTPLWGATSLPFIFFFPAVAAAAWYGHLRPALVAMVLSLLAVDWFFIEPIHSLVPNNAADVAALVTFAAVGLCVVGAIEAMHRANGRSLVALAERECAEHSLAERVRQQEALYKLADRVQRARSVSDIYDSALDAIVAALCCDRAAVQLFDDRGVMHFVASRGLSDSYLRGVERHTPWTPDEAHPEPISIPDVAGADLKDSLKATICNEGIGALAFIPLVDGGKLIGKFMAYYNTPRALTRPELDLAVSIGRQLAFGVLHNRAEEALRENEERLRESQDGLTGLIQSAMDAIVAVNTDQRIVLFNPAAEEIFECAAADALGSPLDRFIPHRFREAHREHVRKLGQSGKTSRRMGALGALRAVRASGEEFPIEASISYTETAGEALYTVILRDITERKNAEAEREKLLEREMELREGAEEAGRFKDEFLATLSHELRNPLNVILGYSEFLLRAEETKSSPQIRKAAEALKRNAKFQAGLIGDLLDLSRLRSRKFTLNCETVSLSATVENAVETVRSEAAAKAVAINIDMPTEPLCIEADPLRLEQIIWNLLHNAVKFTPANGSVSIRLGRENEDVLVIVQDTGQGIDPAFLPHVFDMFRQADSSVTRIQSGMGIGLALVQQLVELHGGSVVASSAGVGRGAEFVVRLPLGRHRSTPAVLRLDIKALPLQGMNILVIDDSKDTTDMLRDLLESEGARVVSAGGAAEALNIAREQTFDAIVCDIVMPVMNGIEFLSRLRVLPAREHVPVLALTAVGRHQPNERHELDGFFAHLEKPVNAEILVTALQSASARTAARARA